MAEPTDDFERLLDVMRRAAAVLRDAGIPYALAGGLAVWARGGPKTEHDVDFLVLPDDAVRAQEALGKAGFRTVDPPEGWLLKAYDGDVLVDLIFRPSGGPVSQEWLERAEPIEVWAIQLPVAALEDVLVTKLLSLSEQNPDFGSSLEIARAVREQIDWDVLRARTSGSPFGKAFLVLVDELGITSAPVR